MTSQNNNKNMNTNNIQIKRGTLQLWQFIIYLLDYKKATNIIQWSNRQNSEFKLVDPEEVARQWGAQKNRPTMNYDKLSRSLRYYYEKNIMQKVNGERYVYKFCCDVNINLDKIISNNQQLNNDNIKVESMLQPQQTRKPLKQRQNNDKYLITSKVKQQQIQQQQQLVNEYNTTPCLPITKKQRYSPYSSSDSSVCSNNTNISSIPNRVPLTTSPNYDLKPISLNTHQQTNYYYQQQEYINQTRQNYDEYSITSQQSSSLSSCPSMSPPCNQTYNHNTNYTSTPTSGLNNFHNEFHIHHYHMYQQQQQQQQQLQQQQQQNNYSYLQPTTTSTPSSSSTNYFLPTNYYNNDYKFNNNNSYPQTHNFYLPTDSSSLSTNQSSTYSMNLSNCQTPPKHQYQNELNYY